MQKRVVLKKGRIVVTQKGKFVLALSKKIYRRLKSLSRRIEVVGSIRRKEKNPVDIDLVLIPKSKEKVVESMKKIGKYVQGGEKKITFKVEGVKIEIYFSEAESWGAMLLSYTGPFGSAIGLRVIAKRKGMLLNQYGLFKKGKPVAGKTEQEIYKALGKSWKKPELR